MRVNTTTTHCRGQITVQDFIPRTFSFSFGFTCSYFDRFIIGSLRGLVYNISIYGTNTTDCLRLGLKGDSFCSFRENGAFPNLIGDNNLNEISFDLILRSYSCYQHSFLCDLFVSKCDPESNDIIPPCREMCHEYLNGCGHIARNFTYFNCDYLPVSKGVIPCLDENVACSFPGFLTDGKYFIRRKSTQRNYSIEFFGNEGFTMEGNSTILCMPNGK